jgi:hypothetical protein
MDVSSALIGKPVLMAEVKEDGADDRIDLRR